jgi:hypothetical protein
VFTELGDEGIGEFLKLCRLAKKEGVTREQVVNLLKLADETNPFGLSSLEKWRKWLIDKIYDFDMQIERSKNYLHRLNDEIARAKQLLNFYTISCERNRQEAGSLNSEISKLETLVSRFKSNNEEYLKIEKTVEEKVKSVLADNKQILQFALAAVIEDIRRNPDKYNNLLVYNSSSSLTAIISTQHSSSSLHYDEEYNAMILEVADKLYNTLLKQLVSTIIDNSTAEFKNLPSQSKLS